MTHFSELYANTSWRKASNMDTDKSEKKSRKERCNEKGMSRKIRMCGKERKICTHYVSHYNTIGHVFCFCVINRSANVN